MATTASRADVGAAPRVRGGALTGTGTLVRFNLRRDRVRLPAWILGIGLVQVAGAASYPDIYPTEADRMTQAAIVADNPAMKAMTGPGHGVDDYTYGAMISNEFLGFMVIFVALMSVLTYVRHTRAEEETGRAELVRASIVGRHAHATAALTVVALANVALGLLVATGLASLGIESVDWAGSLTFGAAFAGIGLFFAAVAAVTTQVSAHSRAAAGMAGALIAVAYALRAVGDVGENALRWLSPIGWVQASAPYVDNTVWPLVLTVAAAAVLVAAGFALSARRDLGAGLRSERPGPPSASRLLASPVGFAWRLQRSALLWWAVGLFVGGAAYGSAVDIMEDYADNEIVRELVAAIGGASITESWLSMIISLIAVVATVFAIIAVLRPRREETSGRAEPVLATALSRIHWVGTHAGVAMVGGLVLLAAAGLGMGLTAAAVAGDAAYAWDVLLASLAYAPALWLTAGVAVAAFGLVPRLAGLAWALLVYAIFIVYFGGLLDLPQWMVNISPFSHIPTMPAAEFTAGPLVVLTALAGALVALGLAAIRRRDLETK